MVLVPITKGPSLWAIIVNKFGISDFGAECHLSDVSGSSQSEEILFEVKNLFKERSIFSEKKVFVSVLITGIKFPKKGTHNLVLEAKPVRVYSNRQRFCGGLEFKITSCLVFYSTHNRKGYVQFDISDIADVF